MTAIALRDMARIGGFRFRLLRVEPIAR